jgi:hypothetical protein
MREAVAAVARACSVIGGAGVTRSRLLHPEGGYEAKMSRRRSIASGTSR